MLHRTSIQCGVCVAHCLKFKCVQLLREKSLLLQHLEQELCLCRSRRIVNCDSPWPTMGGMNDGKFQLKKLINGRYLSTAVGCCDVFLRMTPYFTFFQCACHMRISLV